MTLGPINAQSAYLPIEFEMPDDEELMKELISKRERLTASIVNVKENGQYEAQEILSGQQYFSTDASNVPRRPRYVFRTVVNFGALPNATTASVPHNIAVTSTTIFTRIYATATNPNTAFIPIPFVNVATPTDGIQLNIDPVNVNITTTTANWIAYTTCYVVLEYIKF